jgi:hypothetical protein
MYMPHPASDRPSRGQLEYRILATLLRTRVRLPLVIDRLNPTLFDMAALLAAVNGRVYDEWLLQP